MNHLRFGYSHATGIHRSVTLRNSNSKCISRVVILLQKLAPPSSDVLSKPAQPPIPRQSLRAHLAQVRSGSTCNPQRCFSPAQCYGLVYYRHPQPGRPSVPLHRIFSAATIDKNRGLNRKQARPTISRHELFVLRKTCGFRRCERS